jgi:hypothetical protein
MFDTKDCFNLLDENKKKLLFKIRYLYGLNEQSNQYLNSFFINEQNENVLLLDVDKLQEILVEFILKNRYLSSFKPYFKYRKSFLKSIINIIEKSNNEVNEKLFNDYIDLINNDNQADNKNNEKYFLVVFSKHNDNYEDTPIIIEQYASIIANGTTGLHVWPACFQLMDYLDANEHLLDNK